MFNKKLKQEIDNLHRRFNELQSKFDKKLNKMDRDDIVTSKITIDELQQLGKYESFKANDKTYIISNKKLK